MNILEAYINKYKQIIILIIGQPCTSKSQIAKELVVDLNLPIININNYLIKDKFLEREIDKIKFKLYEHPDNFDWEKLNEDVNKNKNKGLILYGNYLDKQKINFDIDYFFFINMNNNLCKKILIEKKLLPYEYDDKKVQLYFKEIFNPIYEKIKTELKINKFFNIKEDTTFNETYDELFEYLMNLISKKVY